MRNNEKREMLEERKVFKLAYNAKWNWKKKVQIIFGCATGHEFRYENDLKYNTIT